MGHRGGHFLSSPGIPAAHQKRKCEKALLASAMRCTSSRFFIARAAPFGRFEQLAGQTLTHRFFRTLAGRFANPAHRQRGAANRAHFDRHLVVGTADAAALHFDGRLDVVHRLSMKTSSGSLPLLLLIWSKAPINDALGNRLLAAHHQHIDKLGHILTLPNFGSGRNVALRYFSASWHILNPSLPLVRQPSAAWRRTWSATACDP
jgi:hypothetical protein